MNKSYIRKRPRPYHGWIEPIRQAPITSLWLANKSETGNNKERLQTTNCCRNLSHHQTCYPFFFPWETKSQSDAFTIFCVRMSFPSTTRIIYVPLRHPDMSMEHCDLPLIVFEATLPPVAL